MTYFGNTGPRGFISTDNSTSTPLDANDSFVGAWEDVSEYSSITILGVSDADATLYADFSTDGVNVDRAVQLSDGTDGNMGIHSLTAVAQWFRVRVVNDFVEQTELRVQTTYHTSGKVALPTSRLAQTLGNYSDVLNVRSAIVGRTDGGAYLNVPVTSQGHLEVALHDPLLPFGSIHTENLTPVFQTSAVYGINTVEMRETTGNAVTPGGGVGTVTSDNGLFKVKTGTTAFAFATLQSRKRVAYRPGQGVVGRFTALWPSSVADSICVAGFGSAESGFYFGFNGTSFGILWATGGVREIQTLTVTTASTATNNYVVTLAGNATNVTATNNGSTVKTAYEIAQGVYPGWTAMQVGSTVVFLASSAGNKTGTFSLAQTGAATPAAGTFVETVAGVATTDTWIPQSEWNGDKLDGTGSSGVLLDPTKGNAFEIGIQYLGFGAVTFRVEVCSTDGNNATWAVCHTLKFPNTRTTPTLTKPTFPFTMAAYSAGSTTNVEVHVGSVAGFVEGQIVTTGPRLTYDASSTAVAAGSYRALMTIRNNLVYKNKANQAVINVLSFGGAIEDTTPVSLYLIRNGTLAGTPNFTAVSTNSVASRDTAATTVTVTDAEQIIQTIPLGASGHFLLTMEDNVTIQPGETVTVAAQTVTGTASWVLATLNTREDQA